MKILEQALKKEREHTEEKIAQAVQQALMREWGAIVSKQERPAASPNVVRSSLGGRRSTCASTVVLGVDSITYAVDLITARTLCELHIGARNIIIKVASCVAYPHGSHEHLHGRPILEGYTVVEVDKEVH